MAKPSGGPSILTLAIIGGVGYFAYQYFFGTPAAAAPAATPPLTPMPASGPLPSSLSPGATGNPPPAAPTPAGVSALDAYYQAMVKAATAAGFTSGNADQWGYYFAQANGFAAPAPESEGFNRQTNFPANLSSAQYWAAAAPVIAQQKGLQGLGIFGGLGALMRGGM